MQDKNRSHRLKYIKLVLAGINSFSQFLQHQDYNYSYYCYLIIYGLHQDAFKKIFSLGLSGDTAS